MPRNQHSLILGESLGHYRWGRPLAAKL